MAKVVVITTHGDIQVCDSPSTGVAEALFYDIPENIDIVSLYAVPANVPNMLPGKNVGDIVRIINEITSLDKFNQDTSKKDMVKIVNKIREQIIPIDDQVITIKTEVESGNENYTDDPETMSYYYHPDLLYQVDTHPDNRIYNKEFLREEHDIRTKEGKIKHRSFNWKINLLHTTDDKGKPVDLMETLNSNVSALRSASTRTELTTTRLKNIIEYLRSNGIKKIIIIDLSCNVIRRGQYGISARAERHVAIEHSKRATHLTRSESTSSSDSKGRKREPDRKSKDKGKHKGGKKTRKTRKNKNNKNKK